MPFLQKLVCGYRPLVSELEISLSKVSKFQPIIRLTFLKNHNYYDDPIGITPRRDGLVGRVGNKNKECLPCVCEIVGSNSN